MTLHLLATFLTGKYHTSFPSHPKKKEAISISTMVHVIYFVHVLCHGKLLCLFGLDRNQASIQGCNIEVDFSIQPVLKPFVVTLTGSHIRVPRHCGASRDRCLCRMSIIGCDQSLKTDWMHAMSMFLRKLQLYGSCGCRLLEKPGEKKH